MTVQRWSGFTTDDTVGRATWQYCGYPSRLRAWHQSADRTGADSVGTGFTSLRPMESVPPRSTTLLGEQVMEQGNDNDGNADGDSESGIAERCVGRDPTHEKQQKRAHTDLIHEILRRHWLAV
ncbi:MULTISPECIES: hypothetical protein [unclassified Streptomyces]|uniref:hypothetical protein n=1 Tax=unclassified Streptomyces TaxID=2593676 RepID=UPI0036F6D251